MGKRYVKLERNESGIIQGWYSCARCWSEVRVAHDKDGDFITCGDDDCRCEGLIKTKSVHYMIQENEALAREARDVLQIHFEWLRLPKKPRLTEEEYLQELGFKGE